MARSGRFGSLPRAAQDLSSTIQSMIEQYENARDRNIETAWTAGGDFEGRPVTDKRFLEWWQDRRSEVSDDDPMADYYDQMIFNYKFQIAEQKMTLAYTRGKASEADVARFYVREAGKVPRESAIWRDLMTNAARFRKAAAQGRASSSGQNKADRFLNQWNAISDRYESGAATVEQVINEITSASESAASIWALGIQNGEATDFDRVLAQIETDPATAARWPHWRAQLEKADPSFRGHLTVEYLGSMFSRAKSGARKRAELAKRYGYQSYEKQANESLSAYDQKADLANVWDQTQKVVEWLKTAQAAGMGDPKRSPMERAKARATLIDNMEKLHQRALRHGDVLFAGKLQENIYQLQGDPRGNQREGVVDASSFGALSVDNQQGAEGRTITDAAKQDNDDIAMLVAGQGVLHEDATGVITTRPRADQPVEGTMPVVGIETGYTTRTADGRRVTVPDTPVTRVRTGERIIVNVADPRAIDPTTGEPLATTGNRGNDSGTVGYRYMVDGQPMYQLYQSDGTFTWTRDDPFETGAVMQQGSDGKGTWIVTVSPTQSTTETDAEGNIVGLPRGALKDQFEMTPADRAKQERAVTQGQQQSDQARAREVKTDPDAPWAQPGAEWSAAQKSAFKNLSLTNRRFLIDRGFTDIPVSEMTEEKVAAARGGTIPETWAKRTRRPGVDALDAQGQPSDAQEKARRDLFGIEQQMDEQRLWQADPRLLNAEQRALIDRHEAILNSGVLPKSVVDIYKERGRAEAGRGVNDATGARPSRRNDPEDIARQKRIDDVVTMGEGPAQGQAYTDPYERRDQLDRQLTELRASLDAAPGLGVSEEAQRATRQSVQAEIARLEGERRQVLGGSRSVQEDYERAARAVGGLVVQAATDVKGFITGFMSRHAVTDGSVPPDRARQQPNGFTSATTAYYSQDQHKRQELNAIPDTAIMQQLTASDPSYRAGTAGASGLLRLNQTMDEVGTIKRNASSDNSTYTQDRMRSDGLPAQLSTALTGGHEREVATRDAERRAGITTRTGGVTTPRAGTPGWLTAADEEDEGDDGTAIGTGRSVWGSNPFPTFAGVPMVTAPREAPGRKAGEPALKIPVLGSIIGGAGSVSAFEALQEQQRLKLERERASKASFDPMARQPIRPDVSSAAKPVVIKTAKPPPPPPELAPPPPPKAPRKPYVPARSHTYVPPKVYEQGGGKPAGGGGY